MNTNPMQAVDLIDHPEGGRFREVFRSTAKVATSRGARDALTHIYFSLKAGEVSAFHKVDADEVWNLYQGGVQLHLWDGSADEPVTVELTAETNCYCHVVTAGVWQAAEPMGEEVLVGCSVAPGFEFSGFTLLDSKDPLSSRLKARWAPFVASPGQGA